MGLGVASREDERGARRPVRERQRRLRVAAIFRKARFAPESQQRDRVVGSPGGARVVAGDRRREILWRPYDKDAARAREVNGLAGSDGDRLKIGRQAAIAIDGDESFAGLNLRP